MNPEKLILSLLLFLMLLPGLLAAYPQAINQEITTRLANAPAEMHGFNSKEVDVATEDRELYSINI